MFTFLKRKTSAQVAVEDQVEASKAIPTHLFQETNEDFSKDYIKVASKLGVTVQYPSSQTPFKAWLSTEGIPCYNEDAVKKYLNKTLGKNDDEYTHVNQNWLWRSARLGDPVKTKYISANVGPVAPQIKVYSKPIPYPVLLTMERIQSTFPNAYFYISDMYTSDEKAAMRDPFLLVIVGDERYIVERWDEPNFRDRHVSK